MPTTYQSWSVVFGEQPSAAKWNILGTNDAGFNNGTALPVGTCVQIAQNVTTSLQTGTTLLPFDNSIPQSGEGDQYMTQAITPRSATNLLVIDVTFVGSNSAALGTLTAALFQDSTANALAAASQTFTGASYGTNVKLTHTMTAGTTSSTTFKVRVGSSTAGTTYFNGSSAAVLFSTIGKSSLVIREYTV